ncbi:hypothetical protein SPRG_16500 [Saprolegnia parasitica CBS 223.65]|uniref:Major facilitator superfamily associated domain-containing protein n=1 Tax=Saprolegnia parasitica (strain CBS 223.65) TaxID=695850 RepID=A0A067BIW2_SAPPC|nr:hypothetical protein SPRG_16500 [Saprolegnia parasitica CBS 223.65]KDO18123.1 hypothetical protein SPRG_16500 [Saprolegnia parasitica CBS 223.65]|eukprot:XP_012211171.1 hypothetical protein SPRG_16500 [Saprolegnia parasitica CBS 223.65]
MLARNSNALMERVSYVHSIDKDKDAKAVDGDYDATKTPEDLENGALREGDAPVYTSPEILAILYQYAMIGIVYGGVPAMKFPILASYFQLETNVLSSASALMTLGWTIKVFFGMFNDCFPIFGYSRKPYMFIGWTLCAAILVYIACKPAGEPGSNADGSQLALLCTIVGFCYVMADVAQDGLMLTYAQREPLAVRGRLQSLIYSTRSFFMAIIYLICGLCLNSKPFSGDFDWDIGINGYFWILAVPSIINVPVIWFFVKDTKRERVPVGIYFAKFWHLVQLRAVWQVLCFNFLFSFFTGNIGSTATYYVSLHWAKVENLNNQIMGVIGQIIFAFVLMLTGIYGTHWNWRYVLVITVVTANVIDATAQFCTIFAIVRNQWFYLGVPIMENIPIGINFVIGTYVIVELAEAGSEGVMYGLLTTVTNLPSTFGAMITNIIDGQFKYNVALIKQDADETRVQVAYTYLISYLFCIVGCSLVCLLPPQKAAVAELKKHGGRHPVVATSMFESTRCLPLAGGRGCPEGTSHTYLLGIFVPSAVALVAILYTAFVHK